MPTKQKYVDILRKNAVITIFSILLITISACNNKVIKPSADSTPPTVKWDILDTVTKAHQEIIESEYKQDIDTAKIYLVTCKANDPQGLYHMEMKVKAVLNCSKEEGGAIYTKDYEFYTSQKQDFNPDSENKVPTSGFLARNINGSEWNGKNCQNGFESFGVISYILECTAENFFGMKTTSSLILVNKSYNM